MPRTAIIARSREPARVSVARDSKHARKQDLAVALTAPLTAHRFITYHSMSRPMARAAAAFAAAICHTSSTFQVLPCPAFSGKVTPNAQAPWLMKLRHDAGMPSGVHEQAHAGGEGGIGHSIGAVQLRDLLFQAHLRQQQLDALGHRPRAVEPRSLPCRGAAQQRSCEQ